MAWDTPQCPIIVADGSAQMVSAGYDKYSAFASQAWSRAMLQLDALGSVTLDQINPNVTFNVDNSLYSYNRPAKPALPDIQYQNPGDIPDAPAFNSVTAVFTEAPDAPANITPNIDEYAPPAITLGSVPTGAPTPAATAFSVDALALTTDPKPFLTLPDVPPSSLLPEFIVPALPLVPSVPSTSFSFTPTEYTSVLLDKLKAKLSGMIDGDTLLPVAVVQALRDRANAQVDVEELRATQTAYEDFAVRGFETPQGMLVRTLAQVRGKAMEERGKLNRDIFIQEQTVAIENLRFAISTGVGLEGTLIGAHNDAMRLSLEAERASTEIALQILAAEVSLFNGQLQASEIIARIQRDKAASVLELARLQLDAQKTRGEMTEGQWVDGMRALAQQADTYRANLAALQAESASKLADNTMAIEAFKTKLAGFGEERAAFTTEWENWTRKWQTNDVKVKVAEMATNTYATRVQAWSQEQQSVISQANLGIALNDMSLRVWKGKVDAMLAKYTAEKDRLSSLVAVAQNLVDIYKADASVESSASEANMRQLMVGIQQEEARVNVALKNAELAVQQLVENNKLRMANMDDIARTSAQLAASSMSAVNFSAGVRSDLSQDYGCRTSFNYSGAIDQ